MHKTYAKSSALKYM